MGATQNRELQVQSQPILLAFNSRQEDHLKKENRTPLSKKEIVANFMDSFKKIEEDRRESMSKGPKGVEVRVKKVKQIVNADKQNEWEEQDVQGIGLKSKELPAERKSSKKWENAELFVEFKTAPVVGLNQGEQEGRTKKCRISKML